eukprot:TRINITY_DN774435_c0_g1_i1.p1 TRINITY_DN774435_c0_g1~~TRINITY_DN774435_c0_g1_i1.p1  ORF type:complete len:159 (+),score=33.79 TRINITY_DN774435_c0_g1_i1:107-583(+)
MKLKLISLENEEFEVETEVGQMSELVRSMTEDGATTEVPLHNVKSSVLSKILDFCQKHVRDPLPDLEKPLPSEDLTKCGVPQWDIDFINVDQEMLFELILAANYMSIQPLLDLGCAKVASMLKGKSPEQIRKQFGIINDFSPEEEAQVREENRWCEDS